MDASGQRVFERFEASLIALRSRTPHAGAAREAALLRREEIVASTRLAGSSLDGTEVNLLLDRSRATGGHPLDDYLLVRDYAEAARFAADRVPHRAGDPRPFFTMNDIRQLHILAARSAPGLPGAWRDFNPKAEPGGLVVSPPWQIPAEVNALIDRFGRGPAQAPIPLWGARILGTFSRIRPFGSANGRVARLVLGILFARFGLPPVAFTGSAARRYRPALAAAAAREPDVLAVLIARAAVERIDRLVAAGETAAEALIPLAEGGIDRALLYKAAQRGRLQTISRDGRLYTTQTWLDRYRGSRSRAGRRPHR